MHSIKMNGGSQNGSNLFAPVGRINDIHRYFFSEIDKDDIRLDMAFKSLVRLLNLDAISCQLLFVPCFLFCALFP